MVTVHDVRAWAMSLPRTEEHLIHDHVKFRVGRIVYASVSPDETVMGVGFPREERAALIAAEPAKFSLPRLSDQRFHWLHARMAAIGPAEMPGGQPPRAFGAAGAAIGPPGLSGQRKEQKPQDSVVKPALSITISLTARSRPAKYIRARLAQARLDKFPVAEPGEDLVMVPPSPGAQLLVEQLLHLRGLRRVFLVIRARHAEAGDGEIAAGRQRVAQRRRDAGRVLVIGDVVQDRRQQQPDRLAGVGELPHRGIRHSARRGLVPQSVRMLGVGRPLLTGCYPPVAPPGSS